MAETTFLSVPIDPKTRMGAVHLAVGDLPRVRAFYEQTLGLASADAGEGAVRLSAGEEPLIVLHPEPGAKPVQGTTGLYHVALLVPSRPALGRILRHFLRTHVTLAGASDHAVSEALYLADPEGNGVEIYRDRPAAEWPWQGSHVNMTLDPLDFDGLLAESGVSSDWDGMEPGTRVGHVHLKVADVAESRAFYCGLIGFAETQRMGKKALFLAAGGYHHHLGLNTWHSAGAPPAPAGAAGLRRYAIRVPDAGEVERVRARLEGAGIAVEAAGAEIRLTDPSGIRLAIAT